MTNIMRFGKKIGLPSTVAIKYELRLMAVMDDLVTAGMGAMKSGASGTLAGDLALKHGLSADRVGMLVDRFARAERIGIA